jgi:hypothetical protein
VVVVDSIKRPEGFHVGGLRKDNAGLLFEVKKREWDSIPEVVMDLPNWRELLNRKE